MGPNPLILSCAAITTGSVGFTQITSRIFKDTPPIKAHVQAMANLAAIIAFNFFFNGENKETAIYSAMAAIAVSAMVKGLIIYAFEKYGKDGRKDLCRVFDKVVVSGMTQVSMTMLYSMIISVINSNR